MIDKLYDEKITAWIENNKSKIIDYWCELIKVPSIKSEGKENAPFGENCAKALSLANSIFVKEGFEGELFEKSGYALTRYGKGEKKIGLFSHSDVVPVGGDWLYTKPFEPIIKDGSLIGRGAEDNKSGIMAALCLYEILRDCDIPLNSRLETFIGSDEECDMNDLRAYLSEQVQPDVSLVPDADFPCSVGEKGIYHFWCESEKKFSDIIDFSGGEAFNIVLDKAEVKLKLTDELFNELTELTQDKNEFSLLSDGDTITLVAKGIAKHASIPDGSINAAYIASQLLSKCKSLSGSDADILSNAAEILSDSYGKGIGVTHDDVNFGRLTSVNGIVKVKDGKLCLSFDCRYGDTLDADYLESESERVLKSKGFVVTYKNNSAGFSIDKDSKIPEVLEDIYAEISGERLDRVLMSGGTYARKIKNAFSIGTFVIKKDRVAPILTMPEGHGGPHQCDEKIDLEGFFEAVRILTHYVLALDKIINE